MQNGCGATQSPYRLALITSVLIFQLADIYSQSRLFAIFLQLIYVRPWIAMANSHPLLNQVALTSLLSVRSNLCGHSIMGCCPLRTCQLLCSSARKPEEASSLGLRRRTGVRPSRRSVSFASPVTPRPSMLLAELALTPMKYIFTASMLLDWISLQEDAT